MHIFPFLCTPACIVYAYTIYKQSEVWTMEVVDKTHLLPLWGECAMSAHTLNTLSNLVEQALYALLPAHLTPSNFIGPLPPTHLPTLHAFTHTLTQHTHLMPGEKQVLSGYDFPVNLMSWVIVVHAWVLLEMAHE